MSTLSWPGTIFPHRRVASLLREGLDRYAEMDLATAEAAFRKALATARVGGRPATVGDAAEHLYLVLRRRRADEEAADLLGELLAAHVSNRGPDADDTFAWRNELTAVLGRLGRWDDVERLCRERIDSATRRHGKGSREVGYGLVTLAWCLRHRHQFQEAETVGQEALATLESVAGPLAAVTGYALCGIAAARLRMGAADGAEEALRRAVANWERVGDADLAAGAEDRLIDLYVACERHPEALAVSAARLNRRRRYSSAMANDRERQLWNLERHGFLLRATNRALEAEAFETRARFLRTAIEANPQTGDGASEDPDGPLFDCLPVLDWPTAGPSSARAC